MSNLELVLNMLAEATTTEIAKKGGQIAGNTRKEIEVQTGEKIVNSKNAKSLLNNTDNKKVKI